MAGADNFREVRDPNTGKLLLKYDGRRDLIEIRSEQTGGRKVLVDLSPYRDGEACFSQPGGDGSDP